jgi:hypothetical protein
MNSEMVFMLSACSLGAKFLAPLKKTVVRCAVICAVLGVVGNLLTMVVLLTSPMLRRHSTTPFLLSLAASDLIFCGFNLPLTAVRFASTKWSLP